MTKGTISASILTDIANAIRYKDDTATTYKPSEMADAVAARRGRLRGARGHRHGARASQPLHPHLHR